MQSDNNYHWTEHLAEQCSGNLSFLNVLFGTFCAVVFSRQSFSDLSCWSFSICTIVSLNIKEELQTAYLWLQCLFSKHVRQQVREYCEYYLFPYMYTRGNLTLGLNPDLVRSSPFFILTVIILSMRNHVHLYVMIYCKEIFVFL